GEEQAARAKHRSGEPIRGHWRWAGVVEPAARALRHLDVRHDQTSAEDEVQLTAHPICAATSLIAASSGGSRLLRERLNPLAGAVGRSLCVGTTREMLLSSGGMPTMSRLDFAGGGEAKPAAPAYRGVAQGSARRRGA